MLDDVAEPLAGGCGRTFCDRVAAFFAVDAGIGALPVEIDLAGTLSVSKKLAIRTSLELPADAAECLTIPGTHGTDERVTGSHRSCLDFMSSGDTLCSASSGCFLMCSLAAFNNSGSLGLENRRSRQVDLGHLQVRMSEQDTQKERKGKERTRTTSHVVKVRTAFAVHERNCKMWHSAWESPVPHFRQARTQAGSSDDAVSKLRAHTRAWYRAPALRSWASHCRYKPLSINPQVHPTILRDHLRCP